MANMTQQIILEIRRTTYGHLQTTRVYTLMCQEIMNDINRRNAIIAQLRSQPFNANRGSGIGYLLMLQERGMHQVLQIMQLLRQVHFYIHEDFVFQDIITFR